MSTSYNSTPATSALQYTAIQTLSDILTTLQVGGGLTDAQLRASPLAVTGTFWQTTQPVSIASMPTTPVTGVFWQTTQPVSIASMPTTAVTGPLTDNQLRATAVPVSLSGSATSALQTTGNASLASLDTKQPALMSVAPGSDTGQAAIPVRVISQLGAGSGGSGTSIALNDGTTTTQKASVSAAGALKVDVNTMPTVAVTGTFFQSTQPVSIASMPSTPVTGPLTDTQLRATAVPVSGTFFQATQPVSLATAPLPTGAATAAKQPAIGTAGAASADVISVQGVASMTALKVDGSAVTQPVSIASSVAVTGPLTDTQLRATPVPISGTVGVSSMPTVAVTGTFFQATQPVSAAALPLPTGAATETTLSALNTKVTAVNTGAVVLAAMAAATSNPTGNVSLGNSLGKTIVMKTGTLASVAATADQVILTYTVTAGKTFYLEYFDVSCRLTTFAATATNFGNASLESPAATKLYTNMIAGTGITASPIGTPFSEPIPIAAGTVIRIVCTPSAVTAFTWQANLGGYEK